MIDVIQRRLNARYYGALVRPTTDISVHVRLKKPYGTEEPIEKWKKRVEESFHALGQVPCQGIIKVKVQSPLWNMTEGALTIFDDQTVHSIQPLIFEIYNAISGFHLCTKPFDAYIVATVVIQSVFLERESVSVPFATLDTELHVAPTRFLKVTVPSPMMN